MFNFIYGTIKNIWANLTRRRPRVLAWDTTAHAIKSLESAGVEIQTVEVGLIEDWEYSHEVVWVGGNLVVDSNGRACLGSTWATPGVRINGGAIAPCWDWADAVSWGPTEVWPQKALGIIRGVK